MKCLITSATLMGGKWILEKYPNLNNYQPSIDECKEGVIILSRENDGFEYDDLFEKYNIKYHIIIYDDYIE